jgi:hypothetical protein
MGSNSTVDLQVRQSLLQFSHSGVGDLRLPHVKILELGEASQMHQTHVTHVAIRHNRLSHSVGFTESRNNSVPIGIASKVDRTECGLAV